MAIIEPGGSFLLLRHMLQWQKALEENRIVPFSKVKRYRGGNYVFYDDIHFISDGSCPLIKEYSFGFLGGKVLSLYEGSMFPGMTIRYSNVRTQHLWINTCDIELSYFAGENAWHFDEKKTNVPSVVNNTTQLLKYMTSIADACDRGYFKPFSQSAQYDKRNYIYYLDDPEYEVETRLKMRSGPIIFESKVDEHHKEVVSMADEIFPDLKFNCQHLEGSDDVIFISDGIVECMYCGSGQWNIDRAKSYEDIMKRRR